MKLHICIVGNSHVAALKLGWDAIRGENPRINVTFFGSDRAGILALDLREGKLMSLRSRGSFARTSGGLREVDGSYDLYVLCGLYGIGMALALYASHRTDSHKIDKHCFLVSENEFEKVLTDRLGSHPAYKLAAKFRRAFAKPVFLVPLPCFADTATQTRPALKATAESGDGVSLGRIFAQATVAAASEGIRPLAQPDKTVSGGIFTQARFSSGSARLWNGELHEEADYAHMNGDYGEIVMRAIIGAAERSP